MKKWKVFQEKLMKKQKKTDERLDNYAKKAEDMMDKFLQITSSVGTQIQGMNSSIVKMKEKEDDRYKQFNGRITSIEKILDMDENTNIKVKKPNENMLIRIKTKQWLQDSTVKRQSLKLHNS